jgi:hypothetical protein
MVDTDPPRADLCNSSRKSNLRSHAVFKRPGPCIYLAALRFMSFIGRWTSCSVQVSSSLQPSASPSTRQTSNCTSALAVCFRAGWLMKSRRTLISTVSCSRDRKLDPGQEWTWTAVRALHAALIGEPGT